jgi:hypothetical protein
MTTSIRLAFHYGLTIFLSAFLLFQVQPVIGKMILPWFGGSASVWTTCMLFFQTLLLLGYFYSHWIVSKLTPRLQSIVHIALLLLCLPLLPLAPNAHWRPSGAENPTLHILGLLSVSIGLPYFVLSTTGPLVQAWFARERDGAVPYRLFALSNFGSLIALLSYPIAIEPLFPVHIQSWLWSGLFVFFVTSCSLLAWHSQKNAGERRQDPITNVKLRAQDYLLWAFLAACPSILMVADTSYLTEDIAPVPLLWVLPLALYLLSFVVSFDQPRWYQRKVFLPLLGVGLLAMAYLPVVGLSALPRVWSLSINLSAFFVACMVCHGELARLKPHPSRLTVYYLMLAVGGAAGGLFVGVVAPYCFNSNYELSVGIVLTSLVAGVAIVGRYEFRKPLRRALAWGWALALSGLLCGIRVCDHIDALEGADITLRDFYGTLSVYAGGEGVDAYRTMMHGQIIHGRQYVNSSRQDLPTTYYSPDGGAGRALNVLAEQGPLRVGVIGLGVGTLTAYGRPGDYYRIYDINPLVIDLARKQFSFLSRSKARIEIVLGDARLRLEDEDAQNFDLLIVDAFSGDAVPVHLLTREAFAIYFKHLKPHRVLAIHITNRFLDLEPVVMAAAQSFGFDARRVDSKDEKTRQVFHSTWMLISNDTSIWKHPLLKNAIADIRVPNGFQPWSDDYSSVFTVLR